MGDDKNGSDGTAPAAERSPAPPSGADKPLVFISHDSRDAELAECFSALLRRISAGLLKCFRSSDHKASEGIEYGAEWYPEIMKQLKGASDVVCLLTKRSVGRPWILYEAGVARGKLGTPVHGLALGVSLSQAAKGPFAQFQNCEDKEASITKLVLQLAQRIPGSDPDPSDVEENVKRFREQAHEVVESIESGEPDSDPDMPPDEVSAAELFEEVKVMFQELPGRLSGELCLASSSFPLGDS